MKSAVRIEVLPRSMMVFGVIEIGLRVKTGEGEGEGEGERWIGGGFAGDGCGCAKGKERAVQGTEAFWELDSVGGGVSSGETEKGVTRWGRARVVLSIDDESERVAVGADDGEREGDRR